ncbi:MAG: hypothetical protein KTR14_10295 [Vampirovibrio sp.]|nr:hypothetical protein [Vampirovibrio sp.]
MSSDIRDRDLEQSSGHENVLLIRLDRASNSAQALTMLTDAIQTLTFNPEKIQQVNLNVGELMLTQNVLSKMQHILKEAGLQIETIYASLPQTQQAALDSGFFVREKPPAQPFVLNTKPPSFDDLDSIANILDPLKKSDPLWGDKQPLAPPALNIEQVEEVLNISAHQAQTSSDKKNTFYLKQSLRSGKTIQYDGHVTIIGDVHTGSEVTASGDILVWGELRGIAHAGANIDGAKGDYRSEIRAWKIEALQLRIADYIARRPDKMFHHRDVVTEGLVLPEVAKVSDGEIKIYKETIGR